MEVNYELSRAEYEHLYRRCLKDRQGKTLTILLLGFTVFNFLSMHQRSGDIPALIVSLFLTAFLAVVLTVMTHFMAGTAYKGISRSPSWGEARVRLEPGTLHTATHLVKSEIRWEGLSRIAEDDKAFYFYLNPIQVVMVPRRVFASETDATSFWNLAQEYYQYARKTPASRV